MLAKLSGKEKTFKVKYTCDLKGCDYYTLIYIKNNLKNEFFYFFIMKAICIQSTFKKYFLYTMKLLKFHSN